MRNEWIADWLFWTTFMSTRPAAECLLYSVEGPISHEPNPAIRAFFQALFEFYKENIDIRFPR